MPLPTVQIHISFSLTRETSANRSLIKYFNRTCMMGAVNILSGSGVCWLSSSDKKVTSSVHASSPP